MQAKRFEVHVLVNAGVAHVGEWMPMPVWFDNEADAFRRVEQFRDEDRRQYALSRTYRVVEKVTGAGGLQLTLPVRRFA